MKMQILHEIDKKTISSEISGDAAFLLGNKNYGYVYFSTGRRSRYEGVFFRIKNRIYRVMADITLERDVEGLVNRLHSIERFSPKNREIFNLPYGLNSIHYELEKRDWIRIDLDVRESYDTSKESSYDISEEGDGLVVKCDRGDDVFFIAIKSDKLEYTRIGEFKKVYYERDRDRNSPPYELPVYRALKIRSRKVAISFSDDRKTAIDESHYVFDNIKEIKRKQREHVENLIGDVKFKPDEINLAYKCCINSLDQLTTEEGVIAGFPWFFQRWTRDEAISIKNLNRAVKKGILYRDLQHILDDGRIPNIIPDSDSGNADAVGWVFKRIDESLELFNNEERKFIRDKLIKSIIRLNETHVKNHLVFNKVNETWMDTSYNDNGREGARIEIQSLLLNMYRLAYRLTRNSKFKKLEEILRDIVRGRFWDDKFLWDGLDDPTIRPNVFISAYVYPELLTRKEWIKCFENTLHNLWCEWGGLASIDKENPLFIDHSTGEDPRSYHRGDSWYFLNNLSALVMYKTDKNRFKRYIDKIVKASTEDILWQGMIGHHSEISPASKQEAQGCGAQAWSNALYVELIDDVLFPLMPD